MQKDTQTPTPGALATALPARRLDDRTVERVLQFAMRQLERTAKSLNPPNQYPKSTQGDGTWSVVAASGSEQALVGWTQGFLPGSLWDLQQHTGLYGWGAQADRWTRALEAQQYNMRTHDMGFKFYPSFAKAYQRTGIKAYRATALAAAGALASRFNPKVGILSCCDWNRDWQLPLVTDTMTNLELLFWAATQNQVEETVQGQEGWADMALAHALTTLRDMVRPNGSTYHVIDYDPRTGAIRLRATFQGASTESTWSRGHTWAMYGFTLAYRYTRDARMLDAAQRVCDYYVSRVSLSDPIPNWDFDSTRLEKDSSAAAIAASALIELSSFVADPTRQQRYWDTALRTLEVLMTPTYLADGTSSWALLQHGVGHLPANQEINVGLIYGDYYFLEALLRYRRLVPTTVTVWNSRVDFNLSVHILGSGNTGLRTIEFDITPLASGIEGVVGYADISTDVSSFSSTSMQVRLNTTGAFDVRNGGAYAALTRVPYAVNQKYHVRISANVPSKVYSVWVRPPGGSEIQIASNSAFRSDAPFMDDIGLCSVKSITRNDEFVVEDHLLR